MHQGIKDTSDSASNLGGWGSEPRNTPHPSFHENTLPVLCEVEKNLNSDALFGQPPPAEAPEGGSGWGDADALLAMQPHGESGASVAVHYVEMWRRFAQAQVEGMQRILAWDSSDFSVRSIDINQARPSERIQRLFAQVITLTMRPLS